MSDKLRFSRWRRLPGLHRVTEHKIPTHLTEPQRLTLYLTGEIMDLAEELARQAKARSPQHFCEDLLTQALLTEQDKEEKRVEGIVVSAFDALEGYVREEALDTERDLIIEPSEVEDTQPAPPVAPRVAIRLAIPQATILSKTEEELSDRETVIKNPAHPQPSFSADRAAETVMRHAGLRELLNSSAFLPRLRLGECVESPEVSDLFEALDVLEQSLQKDPRLDKSLAQALHRLAYEPQVLISEAWPILAEDLETMKTVRIVQAQVERIFGDH
jgi:hypothetical protein